MKKNLLILIILSLALYSCGNSFGGFDPRAYNSKPNLDVDIPDEDEVEPPPVPDGDDPFKHPDNINPDEIFDDAKFNDWSFRVTDINGQNVPSYKFESDRTWTPLDSFKGEYSHGGGKIGSGLKEINGVTYYRYKSKNPIFKPDSSYNMGNHGERMERFYFYRFTGGAAMNTKLDNYVIAVDTYKKLVFAYAVPTRSYPPGMGYPNVPTAWGSVDSFTKIDGETRPFYEYDPVGFVTEDGSVTVYTWFYNILSKDKYDPAINATYTVNAGSAGPGKSPYFVTYEEGERDPFREAFRNSTYSLRYTDSSMDTLTLHSYEFSYDGNELTYKTEEWFNGTSVAVETFGTYEKVDDNTAKYGNITFKVEGTKLFKDGKHIGTLDYNQDPIFLDRVKDSKFGNGSSWEFNENGRKVVINGSSYQYEKSRDGRTALYGWKNGIGIWYFYSVKLYDDSGKKDHKIMRGSSGGGSGIPMWDVIMTDAGYRDVPPPPPAEDLFLNEVMSKTYSLRIDGSTEILHKYKFSGDGKKVTYYKNTWNGHGDIKKTTYEGYTEDTATSGNYNGTTFRVDGNKLFKGGAHVGTFGYNEEPEFKDIQRGKVYVVRDARVNNTEILYKYTFSPNGETVTYTTQKWLENESAPITIFSGYVGDKPEKATYGGVTFDVREKNKLYKDGIYVGTLSSDYHEEPDYLDRVKGRTYTRKDGKKITTFKFTSDGKSVTETYTGTFAGWGDYETTYTYQKAYSKKRVQYYSFYISAITSYWGFELIDEDPYGTGKMVDSTVTRSTGGASDVYPVGWGTSWAFRPK